MSEDRHKDDIAVTVAPFVRRTLAGIVDLVAVGALYSAVAIAAGLFPWCELPPQRWNLLDHLADLVVTQWADISAGLGVFLGLLLLYGIVGEVLTGRTIGKRIFGFSVIDGSGARPKPGRVVVRQILKLMELPVFLLGYLWAFAGVSRRAIHDYLSGTYVVSTVSERRPTAKKRRHDEPRRSSSPKVYQVDKKKLREYY